MTFEKIHNLSLEEIGPFAPNEETCLTCKYWKDAHPDRRQYVNNTNGVHWRYYDEGECKRYPPFLYDKGTSVSDDVYQQPVTESTWWCGEYQRDINAKIGVAYHFPSGILKQLLCVDPHEIKRYQKQTNQETNQ